MNPKLSVCFIVLHKMDVLCNNVYLKMMKQSTEQEDFTDDMHNGPIGLYIFIYIQNCHDVMSTVDLFAAKRVFLLTSVRHNLPEVILTS